MHRNLRPRRANRSGNVLFVTVFMVGIIGLALLAFLNLTGQESTFSMRSQAWGSALVTAEAGVEEALTHANYRGNANFAAYGWALSGSNYVRTRTAGDGYYAVSISTSLPPIIVAQGYSQVPGQTNYLSRTVRIITTNLSLMGLIALNSVTMSGGSSIDSFDSSFSGGKYNPSNTTDNAYVGVLNGSLGCINTGTGRIYGRAGTGPGGTAVVGSSGGIGAAAWVAANQGKIEPGYFKTDVNISVPTVTAPFTNGYSVPVSGMVNGTNYNIVLNGGKFELPVINLGGSQTMIVTAPSVLYVTGDFGFSGSSYMLISPGATVAIYVGGSQINISGGGVLNGPGTVGACTLYALPSVTKLDYSGSSMFLGSIIAPSASMNISGSGGVAGAALVNSVSLSGGAMFHCDDAANKDALRYVAVGWNEL